MATATTPPSRVHSTWDATIRTMLGAVAVVTLVLLAFAWPTYTSTVKDMPLAVVGTDQQQAALQTRLREAGGAFETRPVADRAAAVSAIERREVYGALVLPAAPAGATEVLTASAGSGPATQMLLGAAQQMGASHAPAAPGARAVPAAPRVTVTDVVPLSDKDPRGTGIGVAGLPLVMGGMIGGVMISTLVVGWKRRLVAVAGYGVLGGLMLTLVLHTWFGFVQGSFVLMWAALGLSIAATAAFITGVHAVVGGPGIGIGAVVTLFLGNPLSSMQSPKEWLPGAWGEIGQYFVPGAAGALMRIESYFPHAPTLRYWLVLLGWCLVGLVLNLVGHHRDDELIHIDGAVEPDPA